MRNPPTTLGTDATATATATVISAFESSSKKSISRSNVSLDRSSRKTQKAYHSSTDVTAPENSNDASFGTRRGSGGSSDNARPIAGTRRSEASTIDLSGSIQLDKPTILMYPRRSVVTTSSSSLRRNSQGSRSVTRNGSQSDTRVTSQTQLETADNSGSSQQQQSTPPLQVSISSVDKLTTRLRDMEMIEEERSRPGSMAVDTSTPPVAVTPSQDRVERNQDYIQYLLHNQERLSSSNFIHKIDSSEIVWKNDEVVIKMIGPYMLGDQIGRGSFGKVKEGICSERLQRVAVKIVNKKRLRKVPNGVDHMVREIKLLRRLKHKNVITLMDVFCKMEDHYGTTGVFNWSGSIEDGPIMWKLENGAQEERTAEVLKWYLVFEYCPVTLQSLLENTDNNRLDPAMAHRFFTQLIEGLAYLHSKGVVHRDIKPGNLLITTDGTLKISDFGISEEHSMFTDLEMQTSSFAGTHQFLSPEIAEGASAFSGEKIDVWACGVTLYNMVTGYYPFEIKEEGNLLDLYDKIMKAEFTMPAYLSDSLQDLITKMLVKDPKDRYGLDEIIKHSWFGLRFPLSLTNQPLQFAYPPPDTPGSPLSPSTPMSATANNSLLRPPRSASPSMRPFDGRKRNSLFLKFSKNSLLPIRPETPKPVIPVTTTLTPYLEELFAEEIEAELKAKGSLDQFCWDAGELDESTTGTKLKLWMAGIFKPTSARSRPSSTFATPNCMSPATSMLPSQPEDQSQ